MCIALYQGRNLQSSKEQYLPSRTLNLGRLLNNHIMRCVTVLSHYTVERNKLRRINLNE